ncbi:hypothetical protein MASR2M15_20540 [Anaerolineales bacterium]
MIEEPFSTEEEFDFEDQALPDLSSEENEIAKPTPSMSWWQRFLPEAWLPVELQGQEQSRRLRELNVSLEMSPTASTVLVLRGELFLETHQYHLAIDDFTTAMELIETELATARWGIVLQGMRDRALLGLRHAQARLA